MTPELVAIVGAALFAGYAVQTITGFGSVVVSITIAAHFVPIPTLLLFILPLSLLQCSYIVIRYRGAIDWHLFLRWIVPLMGAGTALGALLASMASGDLLRRGLAALILVLSIVELIAQYRPAPIGGRRLGTGGKVLGLIGAGVMHGIYASGGPLLVYTVGRAGLEKAAFRSTLTIVWLVLNTGLIAYYLVDGRYHAEQATTLAWLVPAMVAGVFVGEYFHHRIDRARFGRLIYVVLTAAALTLLLR